MLAMRFEVFSNWLGALVISFALLVPALAHAQDAEAEKPFTTAELDQMLAPIALYPDELLSNVLMASTYPLDVVQAARWRNDAANAKLDGDALAKALEAQEWDPSVKALVQFSDVIEQMADKLDWTQKVGDAFLAQQEDVMDRVQFLRAKADKNGSLKSNEQQKVVRQEKYIVIEPAKPEVVYVPVYQPTVVYGSWWYPSYPPYYWYYGRPANAFVRGFFWGAAGVAVANSIWGWNRCDWGRGNININVNKYNQINVNRPKINNNTWKHKPAHRGAVPYRDKATRAKYGRDLEKKRKATRDYRGFDKSKVGKAPSRRPETRPGVKPGQRPAAKPGQKPGGKIDKRPVTKKRDVPKTRDAPKKKSKDVSRPTPKKSRPATKQSRPAPKKRSNAMKVKSGRNVQKHKARGNASRAKAGRGGGRRGGGGRRR
jgi:Protein of unknown function (DUF3300)